MCVPHEVRKTFIQLLELLIIMSSVCEELVPANDVVRVQKFRFQQGLCLGKPHYQDIIQLQLFLFLKTFHVKTFISYLCSCLQDQGDLIFYHCDGHRLHVFHPPAFGYSATAAVSQERLDQVAGGSRR